MSSDEAGEDSERKITIGKITSYGFGILLVLVGLIALIQGPGGILILVAGMFALPPTRRRITNRTGVSFSRTVVVLIVVVSLFAGVAILPSPDNGGAGGEDTPTETGGNDGSTETQTQQSLDHEIGESFTVGGDAQSIEYRVTDAFYQESIGASRTEKADGLFLVVVLEMENVGDNSFDITDRHLRAVDEQDRVFEADFGASAYANNDPRIDAEGIGYEQLNPGLTTTRAVIFDVNPGSEYQLKIKPTGVFSSADAHYVTVGTAELE